ncbi:leghemoglobin-1-like [Pomacea canaliculata]|nr:leghemoglobin-1-like [Pomacea canaliculata]
MSGSQGVAGGAFSLMDVWKMGCCNTKNVHRLSKDPWCIKCTKHNPERVLRTVREQRPFFSDKDQMVITRSWKCFYEKVCSFGVYEFLNLLTDLPEYEEAMRLIKLTSSYKFLSAMDFNAHFLSMLTIIEKCMARLEVDDLPLLEDILHKVGTDHIGRGVNPENFDLVIPPMVAGMKQMLEDKWTEKEDIAWTNFFTLMIHIMQEPAWSTSSIT